MNSASALTGSNEFENLNGFSKKRRQFHNWQRRVDLCFNSN